ncbi:MAG: hypothetical protein ABW022_15725 [Actinoplanes sp.]
MATEQEVRTRAGWIGVEISRSRVRTPGKPGFGLYRVRGSVGMTWSEAREFPRAERAEDLHGRRTEWTAYAFVLTEIELAIKASIEQGTPSGPGMLMLMPSKGSGPALPVAFKVPTRWTQQYRGRRDLGVPQEASASGPIVDEGLPDREAFRNRSSAMTFRCPTELEPSGERCTGTVRIGPDEVRGACDAGGHWTGRDAPGVHAMAAFTEPRQDGKTARQRQRQYNADFQEVHKVARDYGLRRRHAGKLGRGQ